jgi:hypothetical protein
MLPTAAAMSDTAQCAASASAAADSIVSAPLHHSLQEVQQLAQAGKLGKDVLLSSSSSSSEQQRVLRSSKFCLALSVSEHN